MSGIYIPGMEMPTGDNSNSITLFLYPDGKVVLCGMLGPLGDYEAVPIPPHGRLIDADTLMERFSYSPGDTAEDMIWIRAARRVIIEEPTIIPANKETEK